MFQINPDKEFSLMIDSEFLKFSEKLFFYIL